jgi:hypothetical protein
MAGSERVRRCWAGGEMMTMREPALGFSMLPMSVTWPASGIRRKGEVTPFKIETIRVILVIEDACIAPCRGRMGFG